MQLQSKAYRATLPRLADAQLERLQMWTSENCASGLAFRDGSCVIWLASRERAKTKEAFLRSVRSTLKALGICTSGLKGRWLSLTDEEVVHAEMASRPGAELPARDVEGADELAGRHADDDGERTIALPSAPRRSFAPVAVAKA